ncbi:MAG: VTT domain-containing protein [Rhizobiaceae bacterium]
MEIPPLNTAPSAIKRWAPVAVLIGVMVFAFTNGWHEHFTLSSLIMNREMLLAYVADNFALTALTFAATYIMAVALSFPGASLITIGGGFIFGWAYGGLITAFSATIGAAIIFSIASTSFGATLREKAGSRMDKLAKGFEENAFSYLLFLRLVPLFPFWIINLAPAFFNVRLGTYVVATFIGILPGTFAYALLGEGLDSLVEAQEQANPGCAAMGTCEIDLKAAITPEIIAAMVGLAIVSLVPILIQRHRAKKRDLKAPSND